MSKKQINNRLDKLFDGIKEEETKTKKETSSGKRKRKKKESKAQKASDASLSMTLPVSVVQESVAGNQSAMSVPVRFDEESWMNLAFYDEAGREWHEEEKLLAEQVIDQLSLALENARLFKETERRNAELNILNEIISAASQSLDINVALRDVLTKTLDFLGISGGLVSMENLHTGKLEMTVSKGLPKKIVNSIKKHGLDDSLCSYVFDTNETLVLNNLRTDEAPVDVSSLLQAGFFGYTGFPLSARDKTVGTLCMFHNEPLDIPAENLTLLDSVGRQVGFAIENARLFQEAQQRTEELGMLNKIVTEVSSSINLRESLETIAKEVFEIADAIHVGVALMDNERQNLILSADYPDKETDIGLTIPLEGNQTSLEVIEKQKPFTLQDIENNPLAENIREVMLERNTRSLVIFPVLAGKESIGTVGVDFSEPQATLSTEQVNLIQTILLQAGTAIETARLFEQTKEAERVLQRQNDYMTAAAEVGRLVTSTLDMDILFRRAVNLLCEHFGYYHASIFINEEAGLNSVVRESTGEAGREMKERGHSLEVGSKSVVGTATGTGEPFILNDVSKNPNHRPNPLLPETRAEAAIPLKIGRRIIGAIDLQATEVGAFSDEDVAVLQILADQFATAIDNARSYKLAQDAFTEMRELDKLKSQFLANMSHELRTPLNSIIGFSRVILKGIDGPVSDLQQQDLTAIYNSGQHLLGLINDILDLSKIEAGKMELTFDEVDISKLIKSVMSTVIGLIKDKPVRLVEEIEEDLPLVKADSMRVRQVLINLFSNASKFTDEGTITVKAERDGNFVHIGVTDSGPGISKEDQEKLFKAFSQVDASATRATGGTGLGLSICRELVHMHGGIIDVDSDIGKGSTFFFTLPLFYPEAEEDAVETEAAQQESDAPIILSIDDDEQVILLYERYLTTQGYQVVPLTDPKLAVQRVKELKPHAVTLDIMMPGYDGWQVLQDLKSDAETQKIPIIICSIVEDTEKGYSLGATDYLLKPIIEDDLINALTRLDSGGMIREVLVIDDDEDDLRLLEKLLLETKKYEPVLAQGGPAGWKELESMTPHAVILDLFMPELDGFQIIEQMQKKDELKDVPIIIVSGGDLTSNQQEKLNELNHYLIQKGSLDSDGLLEILERTLKQINPNNAEGT